MGYFNGVNYPGLFGWATLLVKIFGLALAVASSLCIGKEGVLAHIGSIVSHMVIYIPLKMFETFRNNTDKRELAIAGTAAGVAAAFGSPIGGTLFAYEVASPCTGWTFLLTWKSFISSCLAVFIINILDALKEGTPVNFTSAAIIKFGAYSPIPYNARDFFSFAVIGCLMGLLGSFFCTVNYFLTKTRKKLLTTRPRKVIETMILVIFTASLLFFLPKFIPYHCVKIDEEGSEVEELLKDNYVRYECPEGYYSPLATILFNPLSTCFKLLMNPAPIFSIQGLVAYVTVWYVMAILTYGTNIPAGLFVSGILIGCAFGRLYGLFTTYYLFS